MFEAGHPDNGTKVHAAGSRLARCRAHCTSAGPPATGTIH